MGKYIQMFLRIIRAYSLEEKIISVILLVMVGVLTAQAVADSFKSGFWGSERGSYSEGLVSDKLIVLNPLFTDFSEPNREISALIFSGLLKYDPKQKTFVDDLAQLTLSEDRKIYRFTLKDKLLWHDGTPLTIDDVYFTFHDLIQHPEFQNHILHANFQGVEIKKVDAHNITFTLQKPNSFFLTNFNVGIVPKHLLEGKAVKDLLSDSFNFNPIGSGPYKIESPLETLADGSQKVTLSFSETYYGTKPKIKTIRFTVFTTTEELKKALGTLNIIPKTSKEGADQLKSSQRFSWVPYELPQYTAVFLNMNSELLKKGSGDKVRLALQKSINKQELLKLFENKTPIDTPLLELKQEDWIYKPNKEEAKGALFDSGYKMEEKSETPYRKDAKGNVLKLRLLVRAYEKGTSMAEETEKVTAFLLNSWKEVGIQVEPQAEEAAQFNERLKKRDYDLLLYGQNMGYNLDTFAFWHSSQVSAEGANLSNYKSFAADSLIERIRDTFENETKERLLKDLAGVISTDIPAVFLFRPKYLFGSDQKVKGIELTNLAYPSDRFANMSEWCIDC